MNTELLGCKVEFVDVAGSRCYQLTGPKGAIYYLFQTVGIPHRYHAINAKRPKAPVSIQGFNIFTDASGKLEAVA